MKLKNIYRTQIDSTSMPQRKNKRANTAQCIYKPQKKSRNKRFEIETDKLTVCIPEIKIVFRVSAREKHQGSVQKEMSRNGDDG